MRRMKMILSIVVTVLLCMLLSLEANADTTKMNAEPMGHDCPIPPGIGEDDFCYILPYKMCRMNGYSQDMARFYEACDEWVANHISDESLPEGVPMSPATLDLEYIRPEKPCILRGMDRCYQFYP